MTKKEAKNHLRDELKKGKSKQEIYLHLQSQFDGNNSEIIKLIRHSATLKQRKRFQLVNWLLVLLILMFLVLSLITINEYGFRQGLLKNIIVVVSFPLILYNVFNFNTEIYKNALYMFVCLLGMSGSNVVSTPEIYTKIYAGLLLMNILVCVYLHFAINKKPVVQQEIYNNELGEERARDFYVFED